VLTSASLTSCGSFDYFLQEAGLRHNPQASALEVGSPFDYAATGHACGWSQTVRRSQECRRLHARDGGAAAGGPGARASAVRLVLFTSQARRCGLPPTPCPRALLDVVLVQGTLSRTRLLASAQRAGGGRAAVGAVWPAIVWRRPGLARGVVRDRFHRQTALHAAQRPGGRSAGRVAAPPGA
jgi:ATP-dependent DNA helicase DinG